MLFLRTLLRAFLESLNVIVFVLPPAMLSDLDASVFGFLARVRSRALPLQVVPVAEVQASLKLTLPCFSCSALLLIYTGAAVRCRRHRQPRRRCHRRRGAGRAGHGATAVQS